MIFINCVPIDYLAELLLEDEVEPDAGGAAIAFAEGVGDVHLDVLFYYLRKAGLGHGVYVLQGRFEVHERRKAEAAFGDVDVAYLAGEVVDVAEELGVDGGKALEAADFERGDQALNRRVAWLFAC